MQYITRMSTHSLTNEVGVRSRSQDLVGEYFRILRICSSGNGSKEDRVLLLLPDLVAETGTDDCSAALYIHIFFTEKLCKCFGIISGTDVIS